jgi:hypothetical protein
MSNTAPPTVHAIREAQALQRQRQAFEAACRAAAHFPFASQRDNTREPAYNRKWLRAWAKLIGKAGALLPETGWEKVLVPADGAPPKIVWAVQFVQAAADGATADEVVEIIEAAREAGEDPGAIGIGLERVPEALAALAESPLTQQAEPEYQAAERDFAKKLETARASLAAISEGIASVRSDIAKQKRARARKPNPADLEKVKEWQREGKTRKFIANRLSNSEEAYKKRLFRWRAAGFID